MTTSALLDRERAARLVREVDERWGSDPDRRRSELENLRDQYFIAHIMRRLAKLADHKEASENQLQEMAVQILAKSGASTSVPEKRRRTLEQERIVAAAKVGWHKLLKTEGIASARRWSRKSQNIPLQSTGELLRRLAEPDLASEDGRKVLRGYIANQTLHLLNVCEQAKRANPQFLSPELHRQIVQLYAACLEP